MHVKKKVIAFTLFLICSSCAEFLEYPLEVEKITLTAPKDDLETDDPVIAFWWEPHQDAKYYRFQLVTPDFDMINAALIDSLTGENKIELILTPGEYSWRVRPENDGSVGQYQYRRFKVTTR